MKYCSVRVECSSDDCKKYDDYRCCVGCEYEHRCEGCCESSWFYTDCDCHVAVEDKSKVKVLKVRK